MPGWNQVVRHTLKGELVMKKFIGPVIAALFGIFCFVGLTTWFNSCVDSRKNQLQELGLFGQHDLRRIEQTSGLNGHMDGSFFLGIGSVSGDIVSERKLQFYWGRTADEFISTTLPYSHFRFVIDELKTTPTIEFIFDERYLDMDVLVYTESEKSNLNWWLDDDSVRKREFRVAVVRISRKDLEKEVYLPRPNGARHGIGKAEKE